MNLFPMSILLLFYFSFNLFKQYSSRHHCCKQATDLTTTFWRTCVKGKINVILQWVSRDGGVYLTYGSHEETFTNLRKQANIVVPRDALKKVGKSYVVTFNIQHLSKLDHIIFAEYLTISCPKGDIEGTIERLRPQPFSELSLGRFDWDCEDGAFRLKASWPSRFHGFIRTENDECTDLNSNPKGAHSWNVRYAYDACGVKFDEKSGSHVVSLFISYVGTCSKPCFTQKVKALCPGKRMSPKISEPTPTADHKNSEGVPNKSSTVTSTRDNPIPIHEIKVENASLGDMAGQEATTSGALSADVVKVVEEPPKIPIKTKCDDMRFILNFVWPKRFYAEVIIADGVCRFEQCRGVPFFYKSFTYTNCGTKMENGYYTNVLRIRLYSECGKKCYEQRAIIKCPILKGQPDAHLTEFLRPTKVSDFHHSEGVWIMLECRNGVIAAKLKTTHECKAVIMFGNDNVKGCVYTSQSPSKNFRTYAVAKNCRGIKRGPKGHSLTTDVTVFINENDKGICNRKDLVFNLTCGGARWSPALLKDEPNRVLEKVDNGSESTDSSENIDEEKMKRAIGELEENRYTEANPEFEFHPKTYCQNGSHTVPPIRITVTPAIFGHGHVSVSEQTLSSKIHSSPATNKITIPTASSKDQTRFGLAQGGHSPTPLQTSVEASKSMIIVPNAEATDTLALKQTTKTGSFEHLISTTIQLLSSSKSTVTEQRSTQPKIKVPEFNVSLTPTTVRQVGALSTVHNKDTPKIDTIATTSKMAAIVTVSDKDTYLTPYEPPPDDTETNEVTTVDTYVDQMTNSVKESSVLCLSGYIAIKLVFNKNFKGRVYTNDNSCYFRLVGERTIICSIGLTECGTKKVGKVYSNRMVIDYHSRDEKVMSSQGLKIACPEKDVEGKNLTESMNDTLKFTSSCNATYMAVTLKFSRPFKSKVLIGSGHGKCQKIGSGKLTMKLNYKLGECDVAKEGKDIVMHVWVDVSWRNELKVYNIYCYAFPKKRRLES